LVLGKEGKGLTGETSVSEQSRQIQRGAPKRSSKEKGERPIQERDEKGKFF